MSAVPEHLRIASWLEGDRRVVALAGELDLATAPAAEDALRAGVDVLELSELEFMDSAGIRIVLRICGTRSEPLVVRGTQPAVRRILDLTGVCEVLRFEDPSPDRIGSRHGS